MSIEYPENLDEWRDHIAGLEGEPLRSKAIAASSFKFVQLLQGDGFSAPDIGEVLQMIARQFVATGQEPTSGGYVDYRALIAQDPELNALYETLDDEDTTMANRQRLTQTLAHKWGSTMIDDAPVSQIKLSTEASAEKVEVTDGIDKTAARVPSGLYGYPKTIQSSCEVSVRKLKRVALSIVKNAYQKDAKVIEFLMAHDKRAKSTPARVLIAAMKEGHSVFSSMGVVGGHPKDAAKSRYGLYGYKSRTAALGLTACSQLREAAGMVSSDLHIRQAAMHERITGFFTQHAKQAKCGYSRMLHVAYPDASMKLASTGADAPKTVDDWLIWEG